MKKTRMTKAILPRRSHLILPEPGVPASGRRRIRRPDLPDRPGPRAALTVSAIPPVSPGGGELLHESRVKTDLPP